MTDCNCKLCTNTRERYAFEDETSMLQAKYEANKALENTLEYGDNHESSSYYHEKWGGKKYDRPQ